MTIEGNRTGARLTVPGIVLGLGLGGFVDGIVLHQILQWHHMVSNVHAPTSLSNLELNTLWDGLFHAGTWVLVVAGLVLLWKAWRRGAVRGSGRALAGWILAGWGIFNLVEGVVDHHLLQIHHVRPGPNELAWDLGFLALGAVLVVVGWAMARNGRSAAVYR
jgi:uncharacterized membrane protein